MIHNFLTVDFLLTAAIFAGLVLWLRPWERDS